MRKLLFLLVAVTSIAYAQNPAAAVKSQEQLETLRTIRPISPDSVLYEMEYTCDYKLDEFLKADIDSPQKLGKVVAMKLMKPFKAMKVFKEMKVNCSAFQVKDSTGAIIYGRNFDYPHENPALVLIHTNPVNGYKSIGMATMTFLKSHRGSLSDGKSDISFAVAAPYMTMDGMNEKGLAISVLALKSESAQQKEKGKHSIMTSVAIRLILDRAATVDEALDLMREYNFCANVKGKTNYHFLISDATGRSVVLEYIKTGEKWVMSVLEENHVTNFYLSEGWREIGGGQERYAKLEEGIGIMDSDKAMELLSKVYQDGSGPNHSRTQWSVVYNLTHGTMAVSILGQYDKIYRRD